MKLSSAVNWEGVEWLEAGYTQDSTGLFLDSRVSDLINRGVGGDVWIRPMYELMNDTRCEDFEDSEGLCACAPKSFMRPSKPPTEQELYLYVCSGHVALWTPAEEAASREAYSALHPLVFMEPVESATSSTECMVSHPVLALDPIFRNRA
jgi:hypothetical protein